MSLVEKAIEKLRAGDAARKQVAPPPVVAKVVNAAAPAFVARDARPELPPYNPNKLVKVDRSALAIMTSCGDGPSVRSA